MNFLTLWRLPFMRVLQIKTWWIMRFTAIFLLAACLQVSAKNFSQEVTLTVKDAALEKVFKEIQKQTGYNFVYNNRLTEKAKHVNLKVFRVPVEEALRQAFKEQPLTYTIIEKTIVIKEKEQVRDEFIPFASPPPPIDITGKITDEEGNPLAGASVKLKGTEKGVAADANGNFTLQIPDANGILVVSYIGYVTQELAAATAGNLNIVLKRQETQMDDVVVVGYGTQKKVTVTGSVAAVKGADLEKAPTMNLSNAIAGRVPGVVVTQASGEPGNDGSAIRIRGSNTLGNNNALIVIDGVPALSGGIERLNPADIESISVLKDASAAIYGARAANGVILVVTKRGKTGKPQLSYDFNQGYSQPTRIPKVNDAWRFAELRNELDVYNLPADEWAAASASFKKTGSYQRPNGDIVTAQYTPEDIEKFRDGSDPWGHPNTNWFDATMKTWSPQSRHNVQLTGGSENIRYFASLGYQNQDGYYRNSAIGYKQYDMRVNLDAKVNQYINASLGLLARQENRFSPTFSSASIFDLLMRASPTTPAYWPNGLPGPDVADGMQPVVQTTDLSGYNRDIRYFYQTNAKVELTNPWIEGLKLTGTASLDKRVQQLKTWQIPWYLYSWDKVSYEADGTTPKLTKGQSGPSQPWLSQGNNDQLGIVLGALLTYDKKLGDHTINLLAGSSRETLSGEGFNALRRYYVATSIDYLFAGGDNEKDNNGGAFEQARLNYFGRVAYNYKEKYMAEFLWRYDGSYIFAEDTRFGFFPGIMAAWRISEENFWKNNVSFISNLKLRGSWGQMGNDQVADQGGEFQYLAAYSMGTYVLGNALQRSLTESRVPNTTITWEVANNANIGMDGTLLNGRISFEFDFFRNLRTNILWAKYGSIPQSTGMTLPLQNLAKIENKGFEFNLGYNNQVNNLRYNVSVNGGFSKNKVLFFDENPGAPEWQRTTGRPMYTGLFYQYDGVFKDEADIAANKLDYSAIVKNIRPGDMKYKDVNGDGKIDGLDRLRHERNSIPTFQGGFNINLQYKNFDFSILFQGALGGQINIQQGFGSGTLSNLLQYIYDNHWSVDNPSSVHPRISDRGSNYYASGNTYWIRSSNYLRLKNAQLGYNLPANTGKKLGVNNLRIYLSGLNLITWDKMKLYDPESETGAGNYYPQARIINAGISVTF